jgi:hypothetical protein
MLRRRVLAAPFAAFVLVACATSQVEPVYSTKAELSFAPARAATCGADVVVKAGQSSTVEVRGGLVTSACACKFTTTDLYGNEVCTSAYDVGAPNPPVCDIVETSPATLATVSASAPYLDCTARADLDASDHALARIIVQCSIPGSVWVTVKATTTTHGDVDSRYLLDVSEDGKCPLAR